MASSSVGRGEPVLASRGLKSYACNVVFVGGGQACQGPCWQGVTWLGVLGKRRLKATSKASSFGCYFP
jgi:hypothetical protein